MTYVPAVFIAISYGIVILCMLMLYGSKKHYSVIERYPLQTLPVTRDIT